MEVLGIVCQLLHHFASKQGLGINLSWPTLKCKQAMHIKPALVDASSIHS